MALPATPRGRFALTSEPPFAATAGASRNTSSITLSKGNSMNDVPKVALAVAVAGGYILGRTKKGRLAFGIATYLAGRRVGLEPQQLLTEGVKRLRELPQFEELSEQLRGEALKAGRQAMGAVADRKLSALADSLQARTERIGKRKEEEPEEEEPEDEYEEEEEEEPEEEEEEGTSEGEPETEEEEPEKPEPRRRRAARKEAGRDEGGRGRGGTRRPAKAAPHKAPARKTTGKKTAPAKKTAAAKKSSAPAKKTAAAKKASAPAKRTAAKKTAAKKASTRRR